jgi:hypothetical protein
MRKQGYGAIDDATDACAQVIDRASGSSRSHAQPPRLANGRIYKNQQMVDLFTKV